MKKKRNIFVIIAVLCILFLSWYLINYVSKTVRYGTYYMETDTESGITPYVRISKNQISFTFDFLSSHLSVGNYSIEDDILTMTTYDGNEKYVFKIDGDTLIFLEDRSSPIKVKNEIQEVKVTDKAKFRLKKKQL
ncbi:MAG TPA: hypothetical protein PK304_03245 [Mobilitalea sp.]|nr:hypothetical protein [Mobilitalea sp.]